MLLSRGISYYAQMLISAVMTCVAYFIIGRKNKKKVGEKYVLGIYDYTVILTYISLGISVFGITRALEGDFKVAIFCLALSGLCDMFDGKIARTKKNRTDDEKNFGIQIDSLCDVVCFGIFRQ